jgi:hypothetical protein
MNMSFVKYVLLAVLGSTAIAPGTSGNVASRTFDAESVSQPRGGAPGEAGDNKNASTTNKNTASNKNAKKPAEKSKKNSGQGGTPAPK